MSIITKPNSSSSSSVSAGVHSYTSGIPDPLLRDYGWDGSGSITSASSNALTLTPTVVSEPLAVNKLWFMQADNVGTVTLALYDENFNLLSAPAGRAVTSDVLGLYHSIDMPANVTLEVGKRYYTALHQTARIVGTHLRANFSENHPVIGLLKPDARFLALPAYLSNGLVLQRPIADFTGNGNAFPASFNAGDTNWSATQSLAYTGIVPA